MADLFDEPSEPAKIGRFTVLRKLGQGGMGLVYACRDASLERDVAVALLNAVTEYQIADEMRVLAEVRIDLMRQFSELSMNRFRAGDVNQVELNLAQLTFVKAIDRALF